ncbi:MAG: S8 family serine peptidase [Bacteroidota bacterium]
MLRNILSGVLCLALSFTATAQTKYYWANGDKVQLTAKTNQFIVTADEAATLVNAPAPQNVKRYQRWGLDMHPFSILEVSSTMSEAEVVATLGFDTDEVQVSPGYALSDGFVIYPTRTVLAKLKDKAEVGAMEGLMSQYNVKETKLLYGLYRMELSDLDQVFDASNALMESGLVEFAHPDFYAPIVKHQDPLFPEQFQMHNTGQTIDGFQGAVDADCNAFEAWDITLGDASITVAVIDDGLEDHEDFEDGNGNSRFTDGFTPVGGNDNGGGIAIPSSNHGVACAGSIAASHNNLGVRGVAPLVNLVSVNIFAANQTNADLGDAFSWSKDNGVDVTSNSWGFNSCTFSVPSLDAAITDSKINGRNGLGIIHLFASGNGYASCVGYPANLDDVVAVGAITNLGVKSLYSNAGPTLDIMAPSNSFDNRGAGVRTTDRMGSAGYTGGNYVFGFGGTSSATPVVAGVAALVLGYAPQLNVDELTNILLTTATDMGDPGFDVLYGNGRVNALAAVLAAGPNDPTCDDGVQNGEETGVDCGGPDCDACPPVDGCADMRLFITLDNYPEETSWTITNDAGDVVEFGGPYGNRPDGSTIAISMCLPEDCYTFSFLDSYGDGICCQYGIGSFEFIQLANDQVIASGGEFGSSVTADFCLGNGGGGKPDTEAPSVPTNLTASNETSSSVDLSWDASTDDVGVIAYDVYVDGDLYSSTAGTTETVEGLDACTDYEFSVSAKDFAGNESGQASTMASTTGCLGNEAEIGAYYFETGFDGWIDGGGDCSRRYTSTRSYEGVYSVRLRDDSGESSSMTSPTFNLSSVGAVTVDFFFYPWSMESGEDFYFMYDGGSGWEVVATFESGADFSNGSFYNAAITLDPSEYDFTSSGRFRFQCDASSNADLVYIDQVVITSAELDPASAGTQISLEEVASFGAQSGPDVQESFFTMSPNPASEFVQIKAVEAIEEVRVYSIDGRQLIQRSLDGMNQTNIDVRDLPAGVYLVSLQTEDEVLTERVVIRR